FEFDLAEPGGDIVHVDDLAVDRQDCVDVVEIRRVRAPKPSFFERSGRLQRRLLTGRDVQRVSGKPGARQAISVDNYCRQRNLGQLGGGVMHLRFDGDVHAAFAHDDVGRVNVHAGGLQAVEKRQRLVDGAGDVKPDVPVDAAVIGVEIVHV